jgi:hypothetical protein
MRSYGVVFLIVITFLLVACGPDGAPNSTLATTSVGLTDEFTPVDPVFREFYDRLGGSNTLGPAISNLFTYENLLCQHTAAGLMVNDPQATGDKRFYLAAIGLQMNIMEPPVPQPQGPGVKYVEGHIIYDKFVPLYNQLGGMLTTGKPLSELHYNPIKRRFEQYFENVGFYLLEDDPSETARLLSYGAWFCDYNCRKLKTGDGMPESYKKIAPEFIDAVSRFGGHLTGFALDEARQTPDGYKEQIFENAALIADKNQPGRVFLRDITGRLGYIPQSLVGPINDPNMYFWKIQGDERGHNVPRFFMDYMAQHGGQEQFGVPIEEYALWKENIYRQCFTNLCMEQHLDGPESMRIRPAPLGYYYKELPMQAAFNMEPEQAAIPPSPQAVTEAQPAAAVDASQIAYPTDPQPTTENFTVQGTSDKITIQVWETYPMLNPGQSQEIGVAVNKNNLPMVGVEPDILITLPDNTTREYYMYPTGEDGKTQSTLDPIVAENGRVIPYIVCVIFQGGEQLCVDDSFIIWNTQ